MRKIVGASRQYIDPDYSQFLFQSLLHSSSIGMAIVNRRMHFKAVNPALAAMNGNPVEEHPNHPISDVLGIPKARVAERIFDRIFSTGQPVLGVEWTGVFPQRRTAGRWVRDYIPVVDGKGKVVEVACGAGDSFA